MDPMPPMAFYLLLTHVGAALVGLGRTRWWIWLPEAATALMVAAFAYASGSSLVGTSYTICATFWLYKWWNDEENRRRRKRLWARVKERVARTRTGKIAVVKA